MLTYIFSRLLIVNLFHVSHFPSSQVHVRNKMLRTELEKKTSLAFFLKDFNTYSQLIISSRASPEITFIKNTLIFTVSRRTGDKRTDGCWKGVKEKSISADLSHGPHNSPPLRVQAVNTDSHVFITLNTSAQPSL